MVSGQRRDQRRCHWPRPARKAVPAAAEGHARPVLSSTFRNRIRQVAHRIPPGAMLRSTRVRICCWHKWRRRAPPYAGPVSGTWGLASPTPSAHSKPGRDIRASHGVQGFVDGEPQFAKPEVDHADLRRGPGTARVRANCLAHGHKTRRPLPETRPHQTLDPLPVPKGFRGLHGAGTRQDTPRSGRVRRARWRRHGGRFAFANITSVHPCSQPAGQRI